MVTMLETMDEVLTEWNGCVIALMRFVSVDVYFLPSEQTPNNIYTQSHLLDHEVVSKYHQKCPPCALGLWGRNTTPTREHFARKPPRCKKRRLLNF